MKKKILFPLLAMFTVLALCLTACGSTETEESKPTEESTPVASETTKSTDTAILVVSFGTSYNDSRDKTIGAIEQAIADKFPQYEVRRAFTSQIIIDKLAKRDNLKIDNVTEALDRAVADGIKNLVVQPTHLMDGLEYNDLKDALKKYEGQFEKITLGEPLLTSDEDFVAVVTAITTATASYDDGKAAIVFMGHGTEADSNAVYQKLQDKLAEAGKANYFIGTVEATPTLDDVVKAMDKRDALTKVVLKPLMVVAGDHANNDMAGDEDDSWKAVLTKKGYDVECLIEGLGENEQIRDIYVAHTQAAVDQLTK